MKYFFKGLDCANCAFKLETYLKTNENINEISIDFSTKSMFVDFKNKEFKIEDLEKIARKKERNFSIIENYNINKEFEEEVEKLKDQKIYMYVSLILFFISLFIELYLEGYVKYDNNLRIYYIPMYFISYIIVAYPILKDAIFSIKNKDFFNEKVFMSISTILAFFIKEYEEATGVMLFYTLGEYFQEISLLKSRKGIKELLNLKENIIHLVKDDKIEDVEVADISIGDIIYVKVGEKILLDGIIVNGESELDTSMITGESIPRVFSIGDNILAGMINISNPIMVKINKNFDESNIYKIVEMVENSGHRKAKMEKIITKLARSYTPIVFTLAILIAIIPPLFFPKVSFYDSIYNAIVLLVISCPCALVLSIPLTFFSGLARAAKEGILVKGSNVFDAIEKSKYVFLDKTGTITEGKFKVYSVYENLESLNIDDKRLYEMVYKIESNSNHPIAKSIVEFISKKYNLISFDGDEEAFNRYINLCNHCGCCHNFSDHYTQNLVINNHNNIGHYEGDKCLSHYESISYTNQNCDCNNHENLVEHNKDLFSKNLKIWDYKEVLGKGIYADISGNKILIGNREYLIENNIEIPEYINVNDSSTKIYVALNSVFRLLFLVKDKIRSDSKIAIENMKKNGIKEIVMLTGDNNEIAKEVSENLGIDRYYSNLLPEDKLKIIEYEIKNKKIMYIGDGVNDAPVITLADVGIAMGNIGQDITIESADVVLNTDSLNKINILYKIGSSINKIIIQNLILILSVKIIVILLGIFSFMSMWIAVFADVGVAIIAILNAIRIKKVKIN